MTNPVVPINGIYPRAAEPVFIVDVNGQPVSGGGGGGAGGSSNSSTSNNTRVPTSTTSTQLLAANPSRVKGYLVQNESSAIMYLLEGAGAASPTNYTQQVPAGTSWSNDGWSGRVAAVLASGTGNAQVTEYLA